MKKKKKAIFIVVDGRGKAQKSPCCGSFDHRGSAGRGRKREGAKIAERQEMLLLRMT
ncbi:MAG: hypothetical protein MZV63_26120 [Marinilabiliales bacterium]|nr:hypothetical protein [Marinilabiliales bacterium]